MVSTQRPSQAEQVASNAWLWADGGCIFADAPNAVTSAAVIVHQISMHRNITPLPVTRQSQASSRASGGFTTIVQGNSSPARSFTLLTRIRWINRCPDRPEGCLQTGKRCFTNRGQPFGSAAPRCAARWDHVQVMLRRAKRLKTRSVPRPVQFMPKREEKSAKLERAKGIEPSWPVWKTGALPLNYARQS